MKPATRILFAIAALAVCFCLTGAAQQKSKTIEQLNTEIRKAQEELDRNTRLLGSTQSSKKSNERDLRIIQNKITAQRKIVAALQQQIGEMNDDIDKNRTEISRLGAERDQLKKEYADMIRQSYVNHLQGNYLSLLFAAKDFDDVTRRINYMRRYNELRERKAARIDSLSGVINHHIDEVNVQLAELDKTKTKRDGELKSLGTTEKDFKTTQAELQKEEKKLSTQIARNRQQILNAQKEIDRIIASENKKQTQTQKTMTAEQLRVATELSGRFDQNRGKLPYPIRGGVILPKMDKADQINKGVRIAGAKGSKVYCVFEGTVVQVIFLQGFKNCVMVRHGSYLTVYGNMTSVAVKTGDKVALNHVLGAISADDDPSQHNLVFQIWKEEVHQNPESWLMP